MTAPQGRSVAHAAGKEIKVGQAYQLAELACPVSHVMRALYDQPLPPDGLNRYFVLSIGEGQRYVQCRMIDGNRVMSCEASSGFYSPAHLRQTGEQTAFIRSKQFAPPAKGGNFTRDFDIADGPDFDTVSVILVALLRNGFTSNVSEPVLVKAPSLGRSLRRIVRRQCVPLS